MEHLVDQHYGPMFAGNMVAMEDRSGFRRKEIYSIFSRFKAICHNKAAKRRRLKPEDVEDISFEDFRNGLPDIAA